MEFSLSEDGDGESEGDEGTEAGEEEEVEEEGKDIPADNSE